MKRRTNRVPSSCWEQLRTGKVWQRLSLALFVAVMTLTAQTAWAASGDTYVVDANGGGDYETISQAVAAATGGETIFIKNGEYTETSKIDIGGKQLTFTGESQVGVIIKSGDNDLFYTISYGYSSIVISKLTFKDISMTNARTPIFIGGDGNVTITDCTFDNCASRYGAMRIYTSGSVTIDNCTFLNTKSSNGSYSSAIDFGGSSTSDWTIKNTVIDGSSISSTNYIFGAIYNERTGGTVTLDNVTIRNCNLGNATGLIATKGDMTIKNSTFEDNYVYRDLSTAGFIFVNGSKTVTIESSLIQGNTNPNYFLSNSASASFNLNYNNIQGNTFKTAFTRSDYGTYTLNANYWGSNELPDGIDAYTWIVENNGEYTLNNGDPLEKEIPVIPYINAEGNTANCTVFTAINGRETTLGAEGKATWYVVKNSNTDENVNNGVDAKYTGTLTLNGDVNLILCDGAEMDVTCSADGIVNNGSLTIYGQSTGDGKLTVSSTNGSGISGGTVNLAGGTINASRYSNCSVIIANGLAYTDGTNTYSGTLTTTQISDIAGQTLSKKEAVPTEGTIYVSETGSDENDGLSEETAIATLAHAVEMAKSKENKTATVYMLNGDYTTDAIDIGDDEGVSLSIIGQEKGEVTIHGTGAYIFDVYGDDLVWNFKNLVFDGISSTARTSAALVLYSENKTGTSSSPKGNFTIDNCNFRNINTKLGAIAIGNDNGNTNITNCIIENVTGCASSTAILTVNGDGTYTLDNVEIKDCKLDENVASSTTSSYLRSVIYVNTYEADVTISNSKIHNNSGPMMSLIESRSKLTIVNTTISDNVVDTSVSGTYGGEYLIWASNDNSDINISQCTITGNTIAKSGKGLFYNQKGSMNVEYSDITGNTVDAFIGSTGTITANNNWWGTNDQPDTKVDKWVIMNVVITDDSHLGVDKEVTIAIDFNHVKTSSGNIEELTDGEIPKESYTVEATAQNGEITPSSVVVNNGEVENQTFEVTNITDVITFACDGAQAEITLEGVEPYRGTIYVATTGSDDNEGSVNAPVATVGKAIELALVDGGSGEIIINEGTYVGNGYHVTGDLTVTGVGDVTLDANNEGRLFYMEYGESANKIELHNLTLTKANGFGAAVYSLANELVLDKVTVDNNNASSFLIQSKGKLTVKNSSITNSKSGDVIQQSGNGDILIKNSVFKDNSVVDVTSVMAVINLGNASGNLVIEDSKFINNTARQGVIKGNYNYNIKVTGTEFSDNTNTVSYGGAIYTSGGTLDISDCVFANNKAARSGGAIYVGYRSTATVDRCIFINNTANTMNDEYYGDAIYDGNKLTVSNSVLLTNSNNYLIYSDGEVNIPLAQNCWWGTNEDPSSLNGYGYYEDDEWNEHDCPQVDVSNWVTMDASFSPAFAQAGDEATITATFSNDNLPDGIPVTFASTSGNLNTVVSTEGAQASTTASTTYTIDANDEAITATSGNATIEMPIGSGFTTNVVTPDNFYTFFDDSGYLRDDVPFDELVFQGDFADTDDIDLVDYIILDRPITITGDYNEDTGEHYAVLNNMGIVIAHEDVAIDNLTLTATTSLGDLIYVGASNVDLTNLNISYIVDDGGANVINVAGTDDESITDVNILNNTIYFESHATTDEELITVINLDYAEDVIVDGNTITADYPSLYVETYDYVHFMMGLCYVNPIRVCESYDVELTNNKVDVTVNSSTASYPTVQALYIAGSEDILVKGNDFKMVDTETPAGTPIYLYGVECGFSEGIEFIENNFDISTTGGQSGAGSVYAIQVATTEATFTGNTITCECNGPNIGIFSPYGFGPAKDLVIQENVINVTGSATGSNDFALISGIEIQTGYATISNNTINVQNKGGYDDSYPVSGISAIQYSASTLTFDIQDNDIYVPDGKYAVEMLYAPSNATVTGNALCAHELTGDAAVYFKSGDNNTVEENVHGSVNMPKTGQSTYNIPANVPSFKVYDDGGISGKYSPGCNGTLTLTAPEGCRLQLSGNIKTEKDNDYLTVYDGSDNQADVLIDQVSSSVNGTLTDIPTVISKGNVMTIYFYSNNSGSNKTEFDGLNLTVTTNIVTQNNFYNFFDESGSLRDDVPFDKLVFQGEFSNLVDYICLDRSITITGDHDEETGEHFAVLNDMGFIIAGTDVTLDNLTLVANSNLGNLIDIACENAVISNMDITYVVDEPANVINVYSGSNGVQILKNKIYFESTVDEYAVDEVTTAICVNSGVSIFDDEDPIEGLVIDGNKITAVIPAFLADIYENEYYVMGLSAVNGVRINGAEDFVFANNTLDVTTNRLDRTTPTFQAMYVASSSGLIDTNDISMIDEFTPVGEDVYLYALELINDEDLTISNNNFNLSTNGGKDEAGSANAIIAIGSDFSVVDNNITTVSKGPNVGIYFPANMGYPCDAVISGNLIKVTGLATAAHNTGLVSGIEIETGYVEISGNTIFTYNIGEYAEGNYIYGISYVQDGRTTPEVEITDNTIITEGRYAISFLKVDNAVITGNNLIAHELKGDDAVYIASGSGNTVENNGPVTLFAANSTNQWMTWCGTNELVTPENVKVYTVSGVNEGDATLSDITGEAIVDGETMNLIPAYTPVIIYRETEGNDAVDAMINAAGTVPESGYDSATGIATSSTNGCTFYGTTTALEPDDLADYYIAGRTYILRGDKFIKADTNEGIAANKCWLMLNSANGARQLSIVIGDGTTAIDNGLLTIDNWAGAEEWYTIDGRKLSGKPTKKGLYINNGMKTVIK